jgi:type VI secretion system protein ImpG
LIESFAMLTSRIRLRLDDEFPEITDSFLGMLYPHYLAPIPSTTIVQMRLDPEWNREGAGLAVERGTMMHTRPVQGVRCRFRTCYPLTLWPMQTSAVEIVPIREGELGCPPGTRAAIRIQLKTQGGRAFAKTGVDRLSFFLDGDPVISHRLYELLFRAPTGVLLRDGNPGGEGSPRPEFRSAEYLQPRGFGPEDGLLPRPPGTSLAYRLLQEYFAFPDKFLFADAGGLSKFAASVPGDALEILVLLGEMPTDLLGKLAPENFKLGCTPAINLFSHQADPIQLKRTIVDYSIVPDAHAPDAYEVYSVEEVSSTSARTGESREYRAFYAMGHGDDDVADIAYWHVSRRPSLRADDRGTEMGLSLVDRRFRPSDHEGGEVLSVKVLCTNRDVPARLPLGDTAGDIRIEGKPGVQAVVALRKPTDVIRPPHRFEGRWKLISHLSLNFLSIVDTARYGRDEQAKWGVEEQSPALAAFRELLKLYDFAESAVTQQRISGLVGLNSRTVLRRIPTPGASVHARGLEVRLRFDEERFAGSGAFLFASVLERFLGLYTSVNSFVQTVAEVRQREGVVKVWPPRAGERQLV